MPEKTLGEIGFLEMWKNDNPQYEFSDCGYEKDWEAAAEAIVAAHEARRWRSIESAEDGVALQVGVWLQNADGSQTWFVPMGMITKQQAITRSYTHWTPIPAPPKEAI